MTNGHNEQGSAGIGGLFDFSFERFITLPIMAVLYGLGMVLIFLGWLLAMVAGANSGGGAFLGMLIFGTLAAVVQLIFLRVALELVVVIFRIHENIKRIAGREDERAE